MAIFLFLLLIIIWGIVPSSTTNTPSCAMSTDSLSRLIFDCSGRHFEVFPSGIPNNTLVLLLRRTMTSPKIPSFQTIGLVKLQILDLSWNSINYFSNDTFKDMTSLLSLDIRGNNALSSVPKGLFNQLINLKTLKIDIYMNLPTDENERLLEETKYLKSLDSFVFHSGFVKFGIQIASQYPYLTSLTIYMCKNDNTSLAQHLHQLRNLTRLTSIAIVRSNLSHVGDNLSFNWMSNIRNINLACNHLNLIDTIRLLGSQTSLSQLDTLILDRIDMSTIITDINILLLSPNIFCNLSFSSNLRRLSIQQIGALYYEAALTRCLQNLRSVSAGHNLFIDVVEYGRFVEPFMKLIVVAKSLTPLYYVKGSFILTSTATRLAFCFGDDVTFDDYFIEQNQIDSQTSICEPAKFDIKRGYVKLPSCLRALQFDHLGQSSEGNGIVPPFNIHIFPNNSLELLDLSHSIFSMDGVTVNAFSISGLKKLRILRLRHMYIKRLYMVTLNHVDNLEEIDLSENRLEQMTAEQLSKMFTKPINVRKLNLSACNIGELHSDFLQQFPNATLLDLSYNKLPHLLLNVSWLSSISHLTINFSFNQISTVNHVFVHTMQQVELYRPITLFIDNNQFRCDCDNIAFLKWFQSTNSSVENKETITCNYRGTSTVHIVSVDISDLEFQCTKLTRIIYISISSVLGITTISLIIGVLLFKYRWHLRWQWYHAKWKLRRLLKKRGYMPLEEQLDYVCYLNYFGVTGEWVMSEMVPRIESWNIGKVFVYGRDSVGGEFLGDIIIETIDRSRFLLYIVGNDSEAGEIQSFHTSLQLSSIARLNGIIVVYRDLISFESLQQRIPLLKSLCRPGRKNPIKIIQFEANGVFCWDELQHCMIDAKTETNETSVCTCKCKKCSYRPN